MYNGTRLLRRSTVYAAAFCALTTVATVAADDQLQWGRQYSRNMTSEERGLPETFDPATGKNIKWSAPLGTQSHGSPVVARGRVLVGTNNGHPRDPRQTGDRGVLMCFDQAGGELLWQLVVPKLENDPYADWPDIGITSPPTVEGDRAYLVSNRGEALCLDLAGMADGNQGPYLDEGRHMARDDAAPTDVGERDADIIWLYDMRAEVGARPHDAANCSILVDGPFLYVCTSNGVDDTHKRVAAPDAPSVIVLDKATGRLVGRDGAGIGPRIIHSLWSSLSLGEVKGRTLVFFGGGDGVCYAFEALKAAPPNDRPVELRTVWRFDCDPSAPKDNPLQYQDNRREGASNISGMPVFHKNRVYVAAGGDVWHGKRQAWLKCIDATKTGEITTGGEVWSAPLERHCISTPAVRDDLVYIADCGGQVRCLDADTGQPYWTHEMSGEIWASTLVADGKVYVGSRRGDFCILAAGKEKRALASVDLGSPMDATPAAAGGTLYIVTMSRLYAVQEDQR